MNRLIVYGCSHATGDYNLSANDKSWSEIVAEKLNYNLINFATSGNSNDGILLNIIDTDFDSSDIVIVMMTFPGRIMIAKDKTVMPSHIKDEWWYKHAADEWFYQFNFIQNLLAIRSKLSGLKHLITFVDPEMLLRYPKHKQLLSNDIVFLPRLTLSKSFELGYDHQHLSPQGHRDIAKFWIEKLSV